VIVSMSPQNPPHAFVVAKLDRLLNAFRGNVSVRIQLPLDLSELSIPEPAVAVVSGRAEDYVTAHPTSALPVVEVADSTVLQDRMTKGPMYATAGIAEYWLVNLRARAVEVFRVPLRQERRYAESRLARDGDHLTVATMPGLSIAVGEILPPA